MTSPGGPNPNPTPQSSADVSASFYGNDQIRSWLDSNAQSYFEENPGILQASQIRGLSGAGFCPPGSILTYGAATPPDGWVLCDGTTYDGTIPTFLNLWTAIGVLYGGSGQSSFQVPDLRGRVTVGYAASGGHTDVSALGNTESTGATAVVQANRRPRHSSTNSLSVGKGSLGASVTDPGHAHAGRNGGSSSALDGTAGGQDFTTGSSVTGISVSITGSPTLSGSIGASGTNPVDAPAYLVLATIIKL